MDRMRRLSFGLIGASTLFALYFYSDLPQDVATHWNAAGIADGYTDKLIAVFLLPALTLFIYGLLSVLPLLDPLKRNVKSFRSSYEGCIVAFVIFMSYLHVLTIMYNVGFRFNMIAALVPGFACMFFLIGSLLQVAKRNWFIGIRTPWTLSSDNVWDKTHRLGAKLFKAGAILSLGGIVFQDFAALFLLLPPALLSLFLVVYSYIKYQKYAN